MQRSVRASAIALCALATLTACEQNSSTEPQDSAAAPDAQPGAASNRDQAAQENPQVSSPESLRLSSSIGDLPPLSSRNLPAPRAQRAVPAISARLPIPTRSSWQPARTVKPAPIQMPNLIVPGSPTDSAIQSQPNLGQPNLVPGQSANPFVSQPSAAPNAIAAAAMTPGSTAAIATATTPQAYSAQLVTSSQPLAQAEAQPTAQMGNQLTNAPVADSAPFSDLQGHWSQRIVSALANNGIVQGFTDGSFRPDQLITQAQFTAMAQKAFPDEAIQPEMIQLRSGMTRASAAKAIYEALADQGRMPPLSTLVAAQPLTLPARQQPSALAALAAAPATLSANPTASSPVNPAEASVTNPGVTSPEATSPEAISPEAIAAPTADQAAANQPANAQPANAPASLAVTQAAPAQSAPLTLATPQVVRPEVVQLNPVAPAAPDPNPSEASAIATPSEAAPAAPTAVTPAAEPSVAPEAPAPNAQATETQPSSMVAVAITGEIIRPGAYNLSKADATHGQPTLMQAIQQAGGVTPSANIRQIQVRRTVEGSTQTLTVNLWQTLQAGDLSKDMVLQPGDTIAIPRAPETATVPVDQTAPPASDQIQVSVVGEVNNPGRRELPPNASASQAILASGGFNQQAQQAELIRLNANGSVARRPIALDLLQDANGGNLALQNNDVIFVQRSNGTATAMRSPSGFTRTPLLGILPF